MPIQRVTHCHHTSVEARLEKQPNSKMDTTYIRGDKKVNQTRNRDIIRCPGAELCKLRREYADLDDTVSTTVVDITLREIQVLCALHRTYLAEDSHQTRS